MDTPALRSPDVWATLKLPFIHSFTNHILSEAASCWSRDKQHLADSEHPTDTAEQMHGNEDTHSSLKVMISKRNKQLIKKCHTKSPPEESETEAHNMGGRSA